MNQDKQIKQRFNEGRDDYNKRLRAASQQAKHDVDISRLGQLATVDLAQIPQGMSISDMIDQMNKTGVLPIQNAPEPKIEEVVSKEMFGLLEYSGDLLAIGTIEPKDYMKLKKLIKSGDPENLVMVSKILNAKIEKDVQSKTDRNRNGESADGA